MCTNGGQFSVGRQRKLMTTGTTVGEPAVNKQRRLLSNVDLFFFVYVAQEVNQAANKGYCR